MSLGSSLSFKYVWLNNKDTFCLYNFIKILSEFPDKCLVLSGWNWWMNLPKIVPSAFGTQFYPTLHLRNLLLCYKKPKNFQKLFKNTHYACKRPLMMAYERSESAQENFGKFHIYPNTLFRQDVTQGQFLAEFNWFEFIVFLFLDWLPYHG